MLTAIEENWSQSASVDINKSGFNLILSLFSINLINYFFHLNLTTKDESHNIYWELHAEEFLSDF